MFVDEAWLIKQHPVQLMLTANKIDGEVVSKVIITLSNELGLKCDLLVAAMRDQTSIKLMVGGDYLAYWVLFYSGGFC